MDDLNIQIPLKIPEFYKGKSVLLTGFTGSIGKLIAEKLLYSCPEINKIYVIIRDKRGKTSQERANEVFQSMAFDRLREKYPGSWESKIVAIPGDMLEDKMGLSKEDENLIRKEVNIIIHGAASVRFDDSLAMAFNQNTYAAKKMIDLALTMPYLESFVYISTAYTNCDHLYIKEEIYPPKADWKDTLEICKKIDSATLQTLHMKYMDKMPNTYVFSKSLSEQIINEYRNQLPVIIVRPSIVVSAWKEPICGWTDNKYGPVALIFGFLFGILRCSWVDVNQMCNYIHSDLCVNAIIITAYKAAFGLKSKPPRDTVTVFNICETLARGMRHEEFSLLYKKGESIKQLEEDKIHLVSVMFVTNEFWYWINILYRHVLPALFIDLILALLKKTPILLKIRMKVYQATKALSYFTMRTFEFEVTRYHRLYDEIHPEDTETFYCEEIEKFNFDDIVERFDNTQKVTRKTLLKPLYDDLDVYRTRLLGLYIVDRSAVFLTHALVLYILYAFSIPQLILSSVVSFFTLA